MPHMHTMRRFRTRSLTHILNPNNGEAAHQIRKRRPRPGDQFNPADAPFHHDGRPGSILDILLGHKIHLEHACGGNCACTTCHVVVKEGMNKLSEAEESEEDMLDKAPGLTPTSRLGCQASGDRSQRRDHHRDPALYH